MKQSTKKFYNQTWFTMSVLFVIAVIVGTFFYNQYYYGDGGQIEIENEIKVVKNKDSKSVITPNYHITVPLEFHLDNYSTKDDLKIVNYGEKQNKDSELEDATLIHIQKFSIRSNEKNFIENELKMETEVINNSNSKFSYKHTDKIKFGEDEEDPIVIQNSEIVTFFTKDNNSLYKAACITAGPDYINRRDLCIKILEGNLQF